MLDTNIFNLHTHIVNSDFTSRPPRQRTHGPSTPSLLISLSYRSRKKRIPVDYNDSQELQTPQVTHTRAQTPYYGTINSLGRAHPQTPVPTSNPLILPTQCHHLRTQPPLTLGVTTVASAPIRNTILAPQRRHAREEKCTRRLQDAQDNTANSSVSVPKYCSRRRRTDSQTSLQHRKLSRTGAVVWTSQGRRPRSAIFGTADVPEWMRMRQLDT
jgi:hypothetical protein